MYQEKVFITSNDVDDHYELKVSTIFKYLQQVSTNHAELLGIGMKDTADKGMFWVITRMKVVIHKMPRMLETLTVTTHPGEMRLFIFPRLYEIYNEQGELVISASSTWVLLDAVTHKIKMKPFDDGFTIPSDLLKEDLPLPEKIRIEDTELVDERKVRYSDIDLNGHLNNTKYIEYIIDTHDINFYNKYYVNSIEINYEKEIRNNEIVKLYSNNQFPELIIGDVDGSHSFICRIEYKER